MSDNQFRIEVMPDGKIKVTSEGGFSQEKHLDADQFLAFIADLAGGAIKTKRLAPTLGNPHSHSHKHGHHHTH